MSPASLRSASRHSTPRTSWPRLGWWCVYPKVWLSAAISFVVSRPMRSSTLVPIHHWIGNEVEWDCTPCEYVSTERRSSTAATFVVRSVGHPFFEEQHVL